jgi:hypothetical protein
MLFKYALMICSAILILTSPISHGEITDAAPGQSVEGSLVLESDGGADIFIEAPDSISDWVLVPSVSPNQREMALKVVASTDWQIAVSSDRPDGRMAEYDLASSEYTPDGRVLQSPLYVSSPGTKDHPEPFEVNLPEGGMICQGGETEEDGQQIMVNLGQRVSWTDEPLEEGQAYRIELTFTISPRG